MILDYFVEMEFLENIFYFTILEKRKRLFSLIFAALGSCSVDESTSDQKRMNTRLTPQMTARTENIIENIFSKVLHCVRLLF